jgi:hypothetical protein
MRRTSSVLPDPGAPSKSTSSDRPCTPRAAISCKEVKNSLERSPRGSRAASHRFARPGHRRGTWVGKVNLAGYRDDHISRQPRLTQAIAYGELFSIVSVRLRPTKRAWIWFFVFFFVCGWEELGVGGWSLARD